MQLNLNAKEWIALLLHLERSPSSGDDVALIEGIRKRLRSVVDASLKDRDVLMADRWLQDQRAKVDVLQQGNRQVVAGIERILTADDDEESGDAYPRRAPKMPRPGRRGRRRHHHN